MVNPKVKSESRSVMSNSLRPHGYSPWNSPGQNTGVGSCSLFQGIFPIQGSNPGLLYCRWILYQLSHQGSPGRFLFSFSCCLVTKSFPTLCDPMDYTVHGILQARILEWIPFPFSRGWLRRNVKCLWKEKARDNQLQSCDQFLK